MKIVFDLFEKEKIVNVGKNIKIEGLSNNTKNIKKNYTFFAIKGIKADGHNFVEEAIKKGANCIIVQDKNIAYSLKEKYPDITVVLSENTRKEQAIVTRRFYDFPDKKLKVIGITGTNGKTSTVNILKQFLKHLGFKVATIGTIGYEFEGKFFGNGMTTPDSIRWFHLLNTFYTLGAEFVISEISSHAIDQYRFYGTEFKGGVFTNLTQDHLDYHRDMETYFSTKKRFIDYVLETHNSIVSINADCPYGVRIIEELKFSNPDRFISYGCSSEDFRILDSKMSLNGLEIIYRFKNHTGTIKTKLLGEFNTYNISAVISFLLKMGFDIEKLEEISHRINPIKGRFEVVYNGKFLVINDYAHTPDALEKVLKSLSSIKRRRIISVFGAGGDRDKTKRPVMGSVAERYSDLIILTSDNPRSERAEDIIEDIKKGISDTKKVKIIVDREEAIGHAISNAEDGDIVLIAGKGHENYQIIGNKVIEFDDSDVARKFLKELV